MMKIFYFDTESQALKIRKEFYNTGFWGSDLTIQYNGNINKYMLIVNNIEDSYRSDFEFDK